MLEGTAGGGIGEEGPGWVGGEHQCCEEGPGKAGFDTGVTVVKAVLVYLSVRPSVRPSTRPSVCLSACLSCLCRWLHALNVMIAFDYYRMRFWQTEMWYLAKDGPGKEGLGQEVSGNSFKVQCPLKSLYSPSRGNMR